MRCFSFVRGAGIVVLLLMASPVSSVAAQGASPEGLALPRQRDAHPLVDPTRPVRAITRNSFTLQYFTSAPCATRVAVREGGLPRTIWRPAGGPPADGRPERIVAGPPGERTFHVVTISGLKPGTRTFYRVFDPAAQPTTMETAWGARPPWRREWAVSTLAPRGRKTVIRLPVKVLLMPNVVNVASAHDAAGRAIAPPPTKLRDDELGVIRREYAIASRFFWVNSGMRYWVDFQFFVDDRWQRWGELGEKSDPFYDGWPVSRSYAGEDFRAPGGGDFTIVDTTDPTRVSREPIREERPFAAQIEQAFVRRWNPSSKKWELYASGGGTLGVDNFPGGVPGRSQFLGGGDTAWLAAHEFHHQMESQGAFSFSNREDDRIVFDHPAPRTQNNAWNTAGRHGEHWDVLAFWDRTLTDAQWLRIYFGETITVADRDEDGFPDDDARLPLDEKRWRSRPDRAETDGRMNDLAKVMLSRWAPAPLQNSFHKPPFQAFAPAPTRPDSDNDGLDDGNDPYPLYPWPPFIWPLRAQVDGDAAEWTSVPLSGEAREGGLHTTFQQAHDDAAYYGVLTLSGPWRRVRVTLDGEGRGVFSGVGVQGFEVMRNGEKGEITVKPQWAGAPGMVWKTGQAPDGATVFEWSLPNRGAGLWYWDGAGREVGAAIEVADANNTVYSVYEPYDLFYARMLPASGRAPLPPGAPAPLTAEQADKVLRPGDPVLKLSGTGWQRDGAVLRHRGSDESVAYVGGLKARAFDLWMRFEAQQDAILAAFTPATRAMSAGSDYVAFVGGYANTVTRLRLFGRETGEAEMRMTPGEHTLQLSRRDGALWVIFDDTPILYAPDPEPDKIVDRLAVIGGYNGDQTLHEIRLRTAP